MSNVNKRILEISNFVEDCYVVQTKTFSPVEYSYIKEIIVKNNIKNVLDIGTGEGTFIAGLASLTPEVSYKAIDADKTLISHAVEKIIQKNICFQNILFDKSFPLQKFDLILSRFAVEHMRNVPQFVSEAFGRLKNGGLFLITEYYIDTLYSENPVWKLFRDKELELYLKIGSHPRISLELPKFMSDNNYTQIESIFHHITPSTVGKDNFYGLIISYAIMYHNIEPKIWTDEVKKKIVEYCNNAHANGTDREDGLFISHTIGRRP